MPVKLDDRGVLTTCPSCGATNRLRYPTLGQKTRCARCQTALPPPASPIEVDSTASFDALVNQSSLPVVVDFWAPWCGPCHAMAPEVDKVAQRKAGEALVIKVNTDAQAELSERFRIRSIPTLAIFRDGREVTRSAGARPAAEIERLIAQHESP